MLIVCNYIVTHKTEKRKKKKENDYVHKFVVYYIHTQIYINKKKIGCIYINI